MTSAYYQLDMVELSRTLFLGVRKSEFAPDTRCIPIIKFECTAQY